MLDHVGGLHVAGQIPVGLLQIQQIPVVAVFLLQFLRPADGLLHLGDLLFQFRVLFFQGRVVLIVLLLVGDPVGHRGVGGLEGGGDGPGQIGQRGGVAGEEGHAGQGHGDDRRGEEDPQAVFFQKVFQKGPLPTSKYQNDHARNVTPKRPSIRLSRSTGRPMTLK